MRIFTDIYIACLPAGRERNMSSTCNVNNNYNLAKTNGIPKSCSKEQTLEILLKALNSSNADQRYAAVRRLINFNISPDIKQSLLKLFEREKDSYVLSALAELFRHQGINKAVPLLLKKLNTPSVREACLYALEVLADASSIPALQKAFKNDPSDTIAILLLNLGDPYPYLYNFAQDDLDIFNDPDNYMKYDVSLGELIFGTAAGSGEGKTFPTKIVTTSASNLKPEAEENLSLMLDVFARKQDGKIIPFLFTLLKHPSNPIPREKIVSVFKECVSHEDFPLLFAELKNSRHPASRLLVLNYLQEQLLRKELDSDLKEKSLQVIIELIDDKEFRGKAVKFLAEVGEKRIIPQLIKIINKDPYCSIEVEALAKLQGSPGFYPVDPDIFESTYEKVLNKKNGENEYKYARDARVNAAAALARLGKRDGIQLLFEGIYDVAAEFAADSSPKKLQALGEAISKVIRHKDIDKIKPFLKPFNPKKAMIGLEFLKQIGGPIDVQLVLPLLQYNKFHNDQYDEIKSKVRLNALLTLATIRSVTDRDTLEVIKQELWSWKSYLAGNENHVVQEIMQRLRIYVRECEREIKREKPTIYSFSFGDSINF